MKLFILSLVLFSSSALAQVATNERILLTTKNTVVLRGEVTDESVLMTQMRLFKAVVQRGSLDYTIYLVLDSPGGSLDAGLGFIEFTKVIRNLKTISIFAASMASGIVEALPGERLIPNNGILMFHRAAGSFKGYFESGEVESQLFVAKQIVLQMETANSNRMKMTLADYKNLVHNELWMYSTTNLTYRAVDRVVDLECSAELINSTTTLTFTSLFGTGTIEFSGCPLMRSPSGGDKAKYTVYTTSNYHIRRLRPAVRGN